MQNTITLIRSLQNEVFKNNILVEMNFMKKLIIGEM